MKQNAMLEALKNLKEGDGFTLKRGKRINHKKGYQVADHGKETRDALEALGFINEMRGNCGLWYSEGIYYVDHSFRVKTEEEALAIGRANNQISVLKWEDKSLIYC